MRINIIAIGKFSHEWIQDGFFEYAKRLPHDYQLNLIEIPAIVRNKTSDIKRLTNTEGQMLLDAVPKNNIVIAFDEHGKEWTTMEFAKKLGTWHDEQQDISLLIGGPDGLAPECLQKARAIWSLSKLTLPHQLVRIIASEQIYRAWSIIVKHPYHRN